MKLNYEFEIMDMGDESVAVPVGDNAEQFHGMVRLNADAVEMLEQIRKSETPQQVLDALLLAHPDEEKEELGQAVCDFLNQLIRAGILIP